MQEFEDIFAIWDSIRDMADDINQLPDTVFRWKLRGRIPEDAWPKIIERAAAREKLITASQIMKLNAVIKRRGRPRQSASA
jgi:hypothetical protein